MASLDPFSSSLVQFVREMPDEAILELVRSQLGVVQSAVGGSSRAGAEVTEAPAPKAARKAAPKAKKAAAKKAPAKKKARRTKRVSEAKAELLNTVEAAVKESKGVSASEVAKATKVPQNRVASALRDLKLAKRIFQGGDRRFARYAGDAKTAVDASLKARATAGGPVRKRGRGKKK